MMAEHNALEMQHKDTFKPGRLVNRSAALQLRRESFTRSTVYDWPSLVAAPVVQLRAFDEAIGDLHDSVGLANHEIYGDARPEVFYGPVQLREQHRVERAHEVAERGFSGGATRLPHLESIQRSFGAHDVSGVSAHLDGAAVSASRALGAHGYASGERVAFASSPDLFTAAHEAAHVVQQRAGVALSDGFGRSGDVYERHADEVASLVVRGQSAEAALGRMAGAGRSASPGDVQLKREQAENLEVSTKAVTPEESEEEKVVRAKANLEAELGSKVERLVRQGAKIDGRLRQDAKLPDGHEEKMKPEQVADLRESLGKVERERVAAERGLAEVVTLEKPSRAELEGHARRFGVGVDDTQDETAVGPTRERVTGSRSRLSMNGYERESGDVTRDASGKVIEGARTTHGVGVGEKEVSFNRAHEGVEGATETTVNVGQGELGLARKNGERGVSGGAIYKDDEVGLKAGWTRPGEGDETRAQFDGKVSTGGVGAKGSYDLAQAGLLKDSPAGKAVRNFKIGGGLDVSVKTTPHPKRKVDPAFADKVVLTAVVKVDGSVAQNLGEKNAALGGSVGLTGGRSRTVTRVYTDEEASCELARLSDAEKAQLTTPREWMAALPMLFSAELDKVGDTRESSRSVGVEGSAKAGPLSGGASKSETKVIRVERVDERRVRVTVTFIASDSVKGEGKAAVGDKVMLGDEVVASASSSVAVQGAREKTKGSSVSVDVDTTAPDWRAEAARIEDELAATHTIVAATAVANRYEMSGWTDSEASAESQGLTAGLEAKVGVKGHDVAAGAELAVKSGSQKSSTIGLEDGVISSENEGSHGFDASVGVMGVPVWKGGVKHGGRTASKGKAGQIALESEETGQRWAPDFKGWDDVNGIGQTIANVLTEETKAVSSHSFGPEDVDVLVGRAKSDAVWRGAGEVLRPVDFAAWMTLQGRLKSPWSLDKDGLRKKLASVPPTDRARLEAELAMALRMRAMSHWLANGAVAQGRIVAVMERPGESWSGRAQQHEQRGVRRSWPASLGEQREDFTKLEVEVPTFAKAVKDNPAYANPYKRASEGRELERRIDAIAKALDDAEGIDGASLGDMQVALSRLRKGVQDALSGAQAKDDSVRKSALQVEHDEALVRLRAFKESEGELKRKHRDMWMSSRRGTLLMTDVARLYDAWIPFIQKARSTGAELGLKVLPVARKGAGYAADPRHEPDKVWFRDAWDADVGGDNPVLAKMLAY